ncbi:alanine racemase [Inquilinus sp. Marseille-Q2685]|uniref:alanine racemase n=1 Tax=Inquilinus sp. Marseille-Q2685 TaxID=2866581 RepID=UPI001CE48235|nr:alanine racemase [Inquilinus sp. Marseille-Q2685]
MTTSLADASGATLIVDLAAIRENYRALRRRLGRAACAAVLKADAYGLGADRIAPVLAAEGCRHFFVAHLEEGIALRPRVPEAAEVFVLHGPMPGCEDIALAHRLTPVLNSLEQVEGWTGLARRLGRALPAVLQLDTGMSRMGLSPAELDRIVDEPRRLDSLDLRLVMSHLACAERQDHPANGTQRLRFDVARRRLPQAPAALANSSGIFLGPDFHYDMARPGAALYGLTPVAGAPNPLRPVVRLQARIVQLRSIAAGDEVGYGLTWRADGPRRIATVAVGYADGFPRSLSNAGIAHFGDAALPIVGAVSMDSLGLDVSALPEGALRPGAMVELIGPHRSVDAIAADAGTIGYEILTRLGRRFRREYRDGQPSPAPSSTLVLEGVPS